MHREVPEFPCSWHSPRATARVAQHYTAVTPTLRFSDFTVDLHRHALTRDGKPVDLSPRLVDILGHLVSQQGQVVAKDTLLDLFWPGVHVTENTVDQSITRIRKAIGDDPVSPLIQTVAGKGVRFAGAVDASGAPPQRDALDHWMTGRLSLEALNAAQLNDATANFERILAANPGYGPAQAALANAYFLQYELTRPEATPNRALLDRAITHARRATAADPSLGEAWAALGFALTGAGEVKEARAAARRATALQPSSWRHQFRLAMACWGQERLDAVDRTLSLMPDFAPARFVAAIVFVARQAFPEAEALGAKGAARQSQDAVGDSPFPPFGLHWLVGLLQLRNGEVAKALDSFDREMNEARPTSIYLREYRVNALVAAGYAHLAGNDPEAAIHAFRRALEILPSNGRALLGLQQAFAHGGCTSEAKSLAARLEERITELANDRRAAEAAMLKAAVEAARGNAKAACDVLERLLNQAPSGQTGWMIPIDPALSLLREQPSFQPVMAQLSARAS